MPELARLTWRDAEAALAQARSSRSVAASSTARTSRSIPTPRSQSPSPGRLADELGDVAILCPPLPYGLSEHHMAFPRTLTLRPASFAGVLSDLVESLARWGVRRVLVVNGHGGNIARHAQSARYGHASEIETSVAMLLSPDSLRDDRLEEPRPAREPDPLTDRPGARVDRVMSFEEGTENGALGDPRLADELIGEAVVGSAYEHMLAFARRLAEEPLPEDRGTWSRR